MNPIEELKYRLDHAAIWTGKLTLKRNEFLTVAGNTNTNLYFVESGSLRVFIVDELEEHTVRFGYKDSFVAALDSFISEKPTGYFIQALKKTQLQIVDKKSYQKLVLADPASQLLSQQIMEQLVYQQMEREIDILTTSPVERYKRVLNRSPQLFQEIPHKYIASYLRMTPETLSRIKKY